MGASPFIATTALSLEVGTLVSYVRGLGSFPDSATMANVQDRWFDLSKRLGGDAEAKAHIVRMLRHAADLIEKGGWPDVYGCDVPDEPFKDNFIETFRVDLSYPWLG